MKRKGKVKRKEKERLVSTVAAEIERWPVLGFVDMYKLPSRQLQLIKRELGESVMLKVCKRNLLRRALRQVDRPRMAELEKLLPQQPALILTRLDSFQLYVTVSRLKMPAYAREGDVAQSEINIPAGPTSLMPGPVISELGRIGVRAGVEAGRVVIKREAVVARSGETISRELAGVLRKLQIQPMEVGLNIVAMWDKGVIYTKEVLELVNEYPGRLRVAAEQALRLSLGVGWPTCQTVRYLLTKAHLHAQALASKMG